MLKEWGIGEAQQHVFLRDEGSNMKKAFKEFGSQHADYGAHELNFVVTTSLFKDQEIKSMLDACRKLVGYFNHSLFAKDLKEEQKGAN
uniref:Uncharacterized protein n=1 Tax=Ditylenchus dipsaci TaxID=166011 RepID=A0A915EKX4_9BILA